MINEAVGRAPTKEMLKKGLAEVVCQNNNKED
jgi:hypothetical protein